jgi:hypothetical protein
VAELKRPADFEMGKRRTLFRRKNLPTIDWDHKAVDDEKESDSVASVRPSGKQDIAPRLDDGDDNDADGDADDDYDEILKLVNGPRHRIQIGAY